MTSHIISVPKKIFGKTPTCHSFQKRPHVPNLHFGFHVSFPGCKRICMVPVVTLAKVVCFTFPLVSFCSWPKHRAVHILDDDMFSPWNLTCILHPPFIYLHGLYLSHLQSVKIYKFKQPKKWDGWEMIRLPFWDTWSIFKVFAVSFRKRRIVYNNTSSESSQTGPKLDLFSFQVSWEIWMFVTSLKVLNL